MGLFSRKKLEEFSVGVEGMRCPMCVKKLTKGLKETSGIHSVNVSLEDKKAVVSYDPAKIDADGIRAVVKECGYQPV